MVRWVQRFPGRLEYELAEFERRDLEFALDEGELGRGRVVLDGSVTVDGEPVVLRVAFPDAYPYFRPEVYAPGLGLHRHQNPYEANLCLLEASTRAWGTHDTAAWLIGERVPYLLGLIQAAGDDLARNEVPQGEPESFYVIREHGTAVFVPEEALRLPEDVPFGDAYFSFSEGRVGAAVHLLLRQVNGRARSGGGVPLAHADDRLRDRFAGPKIEGRWVRIGRLLGRDPNAYFAAATEIQSSLGNPPWQRIGNDEVSILGVLFHEEVGQGIWEDGWLFAVRFRRGKPAVKSGAYITKGERFAPEDLFARVPRLKGIDERTAAVVGLGSLGAPLALELARAQIGELRILDHDLVEGGTIVRWPVGVPAIGSAKTAVLEGTIKDQYPRTNCRSFLHRLGAALQDGNEGGANDFEVMDQMLDTAHVVVDASAEIAVQQLIADIATEKSLPQVYLWATEGVYGGAVARCLPGTTGCWFCLQLAIEDESIPPPPHEPAGTTQPRGCGTRTFTGENFNLLPLVAQAARVTTGVLLGTLPAGQDVFVMALRDRDDPAPAPRWTTYPLERHPCCPLCGSGS